MRSCCSWIGVSCSSIVIVTSELSCSTICAFGWLLSNRKNLLLYVTGCYFRLVDIASRDFSPTLSHLISCRQTVCVVASHGIQYKLVVCRSLVTISLETTSTAALDQCAAAGMSSAVGHAVLFLWLTLSAANMQEGECFWCSLGLQASLSKFSE